MLAAISEGTWAFLAVASTNVVVLVGLFVRQGKQGKSVDRISWAVHHPDGDAKTPTLAERMAIVETHVEVCANNNKRYRAWEYRVLSALGAEVGVVIPSAFDRDDYHSETS